MGKSRKFLNRENTTPWFVIQAGDPFSTKKTQQDP